MSHDSACVHEWLHPSPMFNLHRPQPLALHRPPLSRCKRDSGGRREKETGVCVCVCPALSTVVRTVPSAGRWDIGALLPTRPVFDVNQAVCSALTRAARQSLSMIRSFILAHTTASFVHRLFAAVIVVCFGFRVLFVCWF